MASANYNRMGFKEEKADVKDTMIEEFTSPLVAELRANGGSVSLNFAILRAYTTVIERHSNETWFMKYRKRLRCSHGNRCRVTNRLTVSKAFYIGVICRTADSSPTISH